MGQGITNDGEYYYTSGSITALNLTALAKFTFDDMKMVDSHVNPLPKECKERGNNHIGGISWYNGKLYTSVEGGDECYACIVVFDCETLEPTGEIYDLPNELYDDGVPWCAVDTETGGYNELLLKRPDKRARGRDRRIFLRSDVFNTVDSLGYNG